MYQYFIAQNEYGASIKELHYIFSRSANVTEFRSFGMKVRGRALNCRKKDNGRSDQHLKSVIYFPRKALRVEGKQTNHFINQFIYNRITKNNI